MLAKRRSSMNGVQSCASKTNRSKGSSKKRWLNNVSFEWLSATTWMSRGGYESKSSRQRKSKIGRLSSRCSVCRHSEMPSVTR